MRPNRSATRGIKVRSGFCTLLHGFRAELPPPLGRFSWQLLHKGVKSESRVARSADADAPSTPRSWPQWPSQYDSLVTVTYTTNLHNTMKSIRRTRPT